MSQEKTKYVKSFVKIKVKSVLCEMLNSSKFITTFKKTWISNTIDWEYSSNLPLMSISSYVEYKTGNIYFEKGDIPRRNQSRGISCASSPR